jgi:hypothetical protein
MPILFEQGLSLTVATGSSHVRWRRIFRAWLCRSCRGERTARSSRWPDRVGQDFAMSLQAEDPTQVETSGRGAAGGARPGRLAVEAGARARARNIDMALAVACLLMLFASYFIEPVLVFDVEASAGVAAIGVAEVPLALALALALLVRTSRRQPVAMVDRALQWGLALSLPIYLLAIFWFGVRSGFGYPSALLALAVVVVTVVRHAENAPFSKKSINLAHKADTEVGGVLEVTDVNGVRVRIPAGGGVSPSTNGFAIASLIIAIVGFGGVLAVTFGHIAHSQIRRTGERGWGMATAGLIIGYIGIAVGVAAAIVYFYALSRL